MIHFPPKRTNLGQGHIGPLGPLHIDGASLVFFALDVRWRGIRMASSASAGESIEAEALVAGPFVLVPYQSHRFA